MRTLVDGKQRMETIGTWWMWGAFTALVIVALIVDLLVMRQQGAHKVSFREALQWSMVWIALALAFNGALSALSSGFDASFQQATGVDLDIRMLDFYGLVNQVVADAAGGNNGAVFGITNISTACITPGAGSGQYFFGDATAVACNVAAFSDELHPSSRSHQLLGAVALQTALAPVPEPAEFAMMIAGLLVVATAMRRRAKAAA